MYYTNKARNSHIEEITRIIDVLGNIKNDELSYIDYRRTVEYLATLRDMIKAEITKD
jgi:hypothetical protein